VDEQKRGRIESTIQKELGIIIERDLDVDPNLLITITRVEFSPDNRQANIRTSVFPEQEQEKTLALLNASAKSFIRPLQKRIRMGYIPHLIFIYDPGIVHNARVQELIEKNKESR